MATTLDPTTLTAEQKKAVEGTQAFGTAATAAPAATGTSGGLLPAGYSATTTAGGTQGFDWTPQDDKVDTEVARITAKESALTQQATTRALTGANRRGLLNTTMAVGAAEDAVLAAALPMAGQNAGQTHQKNLSAQEATQARQREAAAAELEKGLIQSRADAESRIQGEKATIDSRLQAEKAAQASALADQEYRQQKGLQELDQASKEKIAAMNVASEDKTRAMAAVSAAEQTYTEAFKQISANNDMPAATRTAYLEHIARIRDTSLQMVEQMYNIDLTWATPVALGATSLAAMEHSNADALASAKAQGAAEARAQYAAQNPHQSMFAYWENGLSGGSNGGGAGDGGGTGASGSAGGAEG